MDEFPKVITAKVSEKQYDYCKSLANALCREGTLKTPTPSEFVRYIISELMGMTREQEALLASDATHSNTTSPDSTVPTIQPSPSAEAFNIPSLLGSSDNIRLP